GVDADKLCEVRNWVDTKEIVPIDRKTSYRDELGLKATDLVALYSGTMSTKQGLELILDAAKEVEQSHPHVRFILCGEGPRKAKLEELAKGLTNVDFIDLQPTSRLVELLGTADIHLLPQRAEAADLVLPSKLGGIFASGRPVVAVAAPGSGLAN